MALVTAGTAKNAVMILQRTSNTADNNLVIAAYMRGTSYSFKRVYVLYYSEERGYLYKGSTILAQNNTTAVPTYQRITLSDNSIKIEMFSTQPEVTGGTPVFTLSSTNSEYLISGTWTYDNAYSRLVSFTSLDMTEYTVTYNANGGSVSPTSAVYSGTPLTLPTPTRAGYTFNGWFTAASGGSQVSSPYTPTANITLYAQWTQIQTGLPLYIGSQQVQKLYIGNQEVLHLYKGSTQIF